jgi:hypothetical protein
MSPQSKAQVFEQYVRKNWKNNPAPDWRGMAIMACGAGGETGEYLEHFKKVIRDYQGNFDLYPAEKHHAALLEFGDALHYMVRIMQYFGFTLEEVMEANMVKLNKRYANTDKSGIARNEAPTHMVVRGVPQ